MYGKINLYDFVDAFRSMGRENQFTYEGLEALFNYLENLEEETGMEMELDVIDLCCNFAEYASLEDFWLDYDRDRFPDLEAIREYTEVIPIKNMAFIIQNF